MNYMFRITFPLTDQHCPGKQKLVTYKTEKKARELLTYYAAMNCGRERLKIDLGGSLVYNARSVL